MKCEPYDKGRWLVESETEPDVIYVVDLFAEIPRCTCRDWECRRQPLAKKYGWKGNTCKHIRYVMDVLFEQYFDILRELNKENNGEND